MYSTLQEQDTINWTHFLMGRFSHKWEDAQKEWIVYMSTKWKRLSHQWVVKSIIVVWEVIWKQWEYRNAILHHELHLWKQQEART